MGRPSSFPEEFRLEAENLVVTTSRPVLQVAKETGHVGGDLWQLVASREKAGKRRAAMPGAISESESEGLRRHL